MPKGKIIIGTVTILLLILASSAIAAEKYPSRPIDFIIGFGVGGGADQMARILGPEMTKVLGVQLPITNISGAGGDVGLSRMLSVRADGYTMAFQNSNSVTNMALGTSPFKLDQFTYIARAHLSDFWLFVNYNDQRFKTWKDVAEFAKKNPGKLSVAVEGLGGGDEIIVRFLADNGIKLRIVPYGDPAKRYMALVGKHEDLMVEQIGDVISFVQNKQIRPVLVFAKKRAKEFPDVACSYENGLKLDFKQWRGFLVKAGTPPAVVKTLYEAMKKAYWSPAYQKALKEWLVDPQETWLELDALNGYVKDYVKEIAALGKKYGLGKK
ncbi:MAG: tripartite tricarboxylate transporter substrate binding protein [Nitrospirae bacterium]|nr:tripartite tricarboxylate transporter substrate binding protein [Nitrospirota bacterium]